MRCTVSCNITMTLKKELSERVKRVGDEREQEAKRRKTEQEEDQALERDVEDDISTITNHPPCFFPVPCLSACLSVLFPGVPSSLLLPQLPTGKPFW